MDQLKINLRTLLEHELGKNESVSWCAQPSAKLLVRSSLTWFALSIPIIVVVGYQLFNTPNAFESFNVTSLLSIPFLMLGIWLMFAPIRAWRSNGNTVYVVTNLRAFTLQAGRDVTLTIFDKTQIMQREKRTEDGLTGDIIFSKSNLSKEKTQQQPTEIGFLDLNDVNVANSQLQALCDQLKP